MWNFAFGFSYLFQVVFQGSVLDWLILFSLGPLLLYSVAVKLFDKMSERNTWF
jgi:hypothetical protein